MQNNETYLGSWKNNLKHGKGIYLFGNGDLYIGEWEMDTMCGLGRYYNSFDGAIIEGNLWNGYKISNLPETNNDDEDEVNLNRRGKGVGSYAFLREEKYVYTG